MWFAFKGGFYFNLPIVQNTAVTIEAQSNPSQGSGTLYANVFYRVLEVGSSF